jgi:hypothetical protein
MRTIFCFLRSVLLAAVLYHAAGAQVSFPLKASPNKRYLVDQRNIPFPILGRTSWCIISQSVSDYRAFIENSLSHGYNAIEMSAICHWPQSNYPPHNGRGDLPFQKRLDGSVWNGSLVYADPNAEAPDLTTPNEAYWTFTDSLLTYCASKGILVFFFPAYLGFVEDGGAVYEGWIQELVANGTGKARAYGAWVANRYRSRKNLVWMLLGDQCRLTAAQRDAEAAFISGLKSVPGQQSVFYSAESCSGMNSADHPDFGDQMTLNGVYSWAPKGDKSISHLGRLAYSRKPVLPAYLLEEPYDEEGPDGNRFNPNAVQPVRRFQWWGWLGTIGGYISGNGYVWPFIHHWLVPHLNSEGTLDMERLNGFIRSLRWWELVPSGMEGMKTLISGAGSNDSSTDYVAAAATGDGTLLVAYIPPDHTGPVTVDMTVLKKKVTGYWFDPASGALYPIAGSPFSNKDKRAFMPPGKNSRGQQDWVLKLTGADE